MSNQWDDRYANAAYAYGEAPNIFLKQELDKLKPGKILFPAEGEGRNAVYAATKGWEVSAFDQSIEGQKKALALAAKNNVQIDYLVDDYKNLPYQNDEFDVIALIYAHFPADLKSPIHQHLLPFLKPGGLIIFEAFSKKHLEYVTLNPKVGGPKDINMLFSKEELESDFSEFDFLTLSESEIELNEGLYHNGTGNVMRFVGVKK
jgi:SAM-dependent methyltransferase